MIKKLILNSFKTNNAVVDMQTKGLTHEDTLLQLPFRGNCLHWVLGHMIASREWVLEAVGQDPVWPKEVSDGFQYNTEPITSSDDPRIMPFEKMLADFKVGLERLEAGLDTLPEEKLEEKDERGNPLAGRMNFAAWHEGYHAGQLEYLRQLAGKDDKVI